MQFWLEIFSIVAAIALVVQVVILTLLFFDLRRTTREYESSGGRFACAGRPHPHAGPDSSGRHPAKISGMVNDASHIVYLARGQAQKIDRVFTDAADRFADNWCMRTAF